MAIIQLTSDTPSGQQAMYVASWVLGASDTGSPMAWSNLADKTVQVFAITGDTVTIQGSNDPRANSDDPATAAAAIWATLTDNLGEAIVFSTAGMKLIAEAPRYIRPKGGAALVSATVIIVANAS